MASKTLGSDNLDDSDSRKPTDTSFFADDATETAGFNRGTNDAEPQEHNVKWQLPGHHDVASAKRTLQELLAYLMVYHPTDVNFIDSKQREWTFQETKDADQFLKESTQLAVQLHPVKNKEKRVIRWVAITRIQSYSTISDWKGNDHFYSAVDAADTYIFPHPFGYEDWDTITIGFIKDIHAVHFPKEILCDYINHMIQKQNKNPPTYQLIPQRITTKDKKAMTKAYTVHCLKEDASQLTHLLTHGSFRDEHHQIFVPFKYKSKNPDLFLRCIRQQNEVYHKTWIIKVEGITGDIMNIIKPEITKIRGIFHIVPSKRVNEIGEWKILVDQSKCSYIHRQLSDSWKVILARVPQDLLDDSPITFSTPCISSKRARDYQDNDSEDDSYGSLLSTGTDASVMTNDDTSLNDLPDSFKFESYAAAAANSTKSSTETQFSSPTTSTFTEWQKEKQDLQNQIRDQAQEIESIKADLHEKINRSNDLEEKLAQAIDLAHSREARLDELMVKFEQLMARCSRDPNLATGTDNHDNSASPPTTPDRPPTGPPPYKKPNTNSSPHRNIYSIFRQPTTKPNSPRARKTTPPSILTQPMETDENPRQPALGAKPSKKSK